MKILRNNNEKNIILNFNTQFKSDLGREENLDIFEQQKMTEIINPIKNYETGRYIFKSHDGITPNPNDLQHNIWYYFYFYGFDNFHDNGFDYRFIGISTRENFNLEQSIKNSFFRLEFYKTPNNEPPTKNNRKLAFSRNLAITTGEETYNEIINKKILIPIFMGSKYKNRENLYFYWFKDLSVLDDTIYSGNVFYMTAKFYNTKDGKITKFGNKSLLPNAAITEENDLYYKVIINNDDMTYQIFNYDELSIGNFETPIKFYEIN